GGWVRKAYRSVGWAAASSVMSGASMWLDARAGVMAAMPANRMAPRARRWAVHRFVRVSDSDKLRMLCVTVDFPCLERTRPPEVISDAIGKSGVSTSREPVRREAAKSFSEKKLQ